MWVFIYYYSHNNIIITVSNHFDKLIWWKCIYFLLLYWVCGLAQSLSLKFFKLLLPMVHNNPLLMDPSTFRYTAKELDVILPVTCAENIK